MISVMNNDFDLERNQKQASSTASEPEEEPSRVSDHDRAGEGLSEGEVNLKEGTRVSSLGHDLGELKSEARVLSGSGYVEEEEKDKVRVLDGAHHCLNGDSGDMLRTRVPSGNDGDGEMGFSSRVKDEESRDSKNEVVVVPESSGVSSSSDRVEGRDLSRGTVKQKSGGPKDEGLVEADGMVGQFRMEKRSDFRGLVSRDVGGSDMNGFVAAGSIKVLGGFEMGDMVWGKVKSHPWWPGHIFSDAFATTSVRRTRRDGHVLVAFFGDSSYGWFDPTELIPYDPNYAEKSQQTTSRSFLRAVEESVDEASRRSALGLSCRCRNPHNFQPTNVPGYMAVDVVDYEPGTVYSVSQIQRARESFHPFDTLSFIRDLAAAPRSGGDKSLDFIKQKATALAYRRSIFEEFDETYAQAFGQQPVRPSQESEPPTDKGPSRAPLSGPLVFAETLGGRKSSSKASKSKELSEKDRYLFKRRDEAGDLRTTQISQAHPSSSSSSAYEDGTYDSAAGYVLQKRDHAGSTKSDLGGIPASDQVATSAHHVATKEVPTAGVDVSAKTVSLDASNLFQQSESSVAMAVDISDVHGQVPDGHVSSITSPDAVHLSVSSAPVKKKKKKKDAKRLAGERGSEKPDIPVRNMKKLRKTDGERSIDHPERPSSGSDATTYIVKPAGRSMQNTAASREDSQVSNRKKDIEMSNSIPQQGGSVPVEKVGEAELAQLLADLQGLALNPFHGVERNSPAITRQFFLKFRSAVFLKSSSALSPPESEPSDGRAVRSLPTAESADKPPAESNKATSSLKSSKIVARHDDPAKGGRKRIPSERREEIAAKRAKKITEVKSLSAEKRALLKNPEMQRADVKMKVSAAQQPPSKLIKTEQHIKKMDRPRVEEPTYLVMKFQSGSSLPSLVELKARFARFGPMDTSLSRVFYTTNTCRVAFLYKQDANVAYRYAMGSKSVFSNVKFMLKPVAAPEPQQPSSGKPEDLHGEPGSIRDSSAMDRPTVPATPLVQQQQQQPVQQLKSCLKKSSGGDDPSGPSSGTVRAPRVRFNMGEDKGGGASNRGGVQVQVDSRNALSSSFEGGPSSSSSSVGMDVVSNNQRFMSSHPLQAPLLPSPQFPRSSINNPQHHVDVAQRNNYIYNLAATTGPAGPALPPLPPIQAPLPPPNIDISQQMMSLLTRCHDVVTNVTSILGYVPYHPL